MSNNSSDVLVTNSLFNSNTTPGDGGGVSNIDASSNYTNCVFTANEADEGAGFFNSAGPSPNIINCTFFANLPGPMGGAIRNNTGTTPIITNCILWGNTSEMVSGAPAPFVTYSIIEGGHVGVGNMDVDPMFAGVDDLRITPCSPAVDAGLNTANSTMYDIIGNGRIFNAKGTAAIDMGAYELPADLTLPSTWTGNGDGTLWSDSLNWNDLFVPQKCRDVLIPATYNVIVPDGYEALGKTLEVELGADLVTEPTATMDIGN